MKHKITLLLLLFFTLFTLSLSAQQKIKVACVGNSITYGHGIQDREHDSYPGVLAKLLGESYEVHNYGISGTTLIDKGSNPYMRSQFYTDAQELNPDIVTIKLGTNDSKPAVWQYKEQFVNDLEQMLVTFEQLPSKPVIYLCYPVPATSSNWEITDSVIVNHIIPLIGKAANRHNIRVIDLYTALKPYPELFPDGIHPNEQGSAKIAEIIYGVLTEKE